jgi:hypothetical protein
MIETGRAQTPELHSGDKRKARKLETIPEAVRAVLGEYFKMRETT